MTGAIKPVVMDFIFFFFIKIVMLVFDSSFLTNFFAGVPLCKYRYG